MRPYVSYKPSGVAWLGDVPSHWAVKRVKHVASMQSGEGITAEDIEGSGSYPVYGGNGRRGFTERATHSGEFVLVGRQGALCGNVHHVKGEFWASEHAVVSTFYAHDSPRWAAYLFELMDFGQYSVSAAQPGLAVERVQQLELVAPTSTEQRGIADYLDTETARIDELIREKDGLIELLREHRQGVASDAVVRGLRRDRPMKPVKGEFDAIPAHWRAVPLKRFVRVSGGHTPATENPAYWDGAMPWVSPKDMKREELSDSIDHVTDAAVQDCGLAVVAPGATLVVVRGMILAHSFPVARNLVPVTINQDMKAIRPECDVLPEYLPWLLRGVTPVVLSLTEQSAHGTLALRTDKFFGEALPIPPAGEQAEIVAFLQAELPKIDELIAHTQDEIRLLKELRAATIADAVLGRLDVRSADAAGQPPTSNNPSV